MKSSSSAWLLIVLGDNGAWVVTLRIRSPTPCRLSKFSWHCHCSCLRKLRLQSSPSMHDLSSVAFSMNTPWWSKVESSQSLSFFLSLSFSLRFPFPKKGFLYLTGFKLKQKNCFLAAMVVERCWDLAVGACGWGMHCLVVLCFVSQYWGQILLSYSCIMGNPLYPLNNHYSLQHIKAWQWWVGPPAKPAMELSTTKWFMWWMRTGIVWYPLLMFPIEIILILIPLTLLNLITFRSSSLIPNSPQKFGHNLQRYIYFWLTLKSWPYTEKIHKV